jgi:hypothetical protein
MGHFTIDLPAERKGEVRFGKIVKETANFFDLFRRRGYNREEKTGYIIKIDSAAGDKKVYHLLRSGKGEWLTESDGGFLIAEEDEISIAIKQAIDEYENQKVKLHGG